MVSNMPKKARTKKPAEPQSNVTPTAPPAATVPAPPRERTPKEQALVDAFFTRARSSRLPKVRMEGKAITPAMDDHALWIGQLSDLTKIDDYDFLMHLVSQGAHCVWQAQSDYGLNCTVAGVAAIAPRDS